MYFLKLLEKPTPLNTSWQTEPLNDTRHIGPDIAIYRTVRIVTTAYDDVEVNECSWLRYFHYKLLKARKKLF